MKPAANQPQHRYMLTFQAAFRGPQGQASMKMVNISTNRSKKNIPLGLLNQAKEGVVMQLSMFGIEPENVVDVAFLNASYLGLMTEKEFLAGLDENQSASVTIAETASSDLDNDPTKIQD